MDGVRLVAIQLDNWKSFGRVPTRNVIHLAPLTILVGPNASGKSNALDALRFLQGAAFGHPLGDVLRGRSEGGREIWPGIRGGVVEASRSGQHAFALWTCWEGVLAPGSSERVTHLLHVDTDDDVSVVREALYKGRNEEEYFFHTHASALGQKVGRNAGGGINVVLRTDDGAKSLPTMLSGASSLLGQVRAISTTTEGAVATAREVQSAMRRAIFLDIQPAKMRDYRPINGGQLGTSGENISPVLQALHQQPERLQDVLDWLSELCAPAVKEIAFDETQLREVMMFLVEAGGARISARSMSDGTLRFLGLVTALLTSEPGTLLVLEEPDAGLHPSRIHLLAELLERVTRERRIQVVATTHSPTLLAHLSEASLKDVVAFGRDADSGVTVCSRLADLEHFDELKESDHLERLISTGWMERAL
jgi:predicted ATPase